MWAVVHYSYNNPPVIVAEFDSLLKASKKANELAAKSTDKYERFLPRLESALVRRPLDYSTSENGGSRSVKRDKNSIYRR